MKRYLVKLFTVCGLLSLPFCFAQAATLSHDQIASQLSHNTNLSPKAIEMAFAGYNWAIKNQKVQNKDILTIIDFSVPSNKNRLYVINLNTGKIILGLPVSHGKNSGFQSKWTNEFSNSHNSLQSSIGVYLTRNTYFGGHGLSLKIDGLEESNNNALKRNVVVHSANYATPEFIKKFGRVGTSWGCFAVAPNQNKKLIKYIENGSVIYAYGESEHYIATTKILKNKA